MTSCTLQSCVSARPRCTLFLFTRTRIQSNSRNPLSMQTQSCLHAVPKTTPLFARNKLVSDTPQVMATHLCSYFHSWKASHNASCMGTVFTKTALLSSARSPQNCSVHFLLALAALTKKGWKKQNKKRKHKIKLNGSKHESTSRCSYQWQRTFTLCTCAHVDQTVQRHLVHFSACLWVFDDVTRVAAFGFSHKTTTTIERNSEQETSLAFCNSQFPHYVNYVRGKRHMRQQLIC